MSPGVPEMRPCSVTAARVLISLLICLEGKTGSLEALDY